MAAPLPELKPSDGRSLTLDSLRQWRVYSGLLEGLPTRERNDAELASIIAQARETDRHEPYVVIPQQRPIKYEGRYPFGEPASLPGICCVARFTSHQPARDQKMDGSVLTVIWFQDGYAFPLSEAAAQAIARLDWQELARDIEY
jgi:hypothetical protein